LTSSYFANESHENKKRVKNFKRVCFIVFSGDVDQYYSRLSPLLDKISEVLKTQESQHPSLLVLVYFCLRVLILKLSSQNLNNLFRHIWPMILTGLIQIFTVVKENNYISVRQNNNSAKNPNLLLAAMKIIETLSITGLDQFYFHQWMFVFDYFGIEIEPR